MVTEIVTVLPAVAGFGDVTTVNDVPISSIVCRRVALSDSSYCPFPSYCAVMLCDPVSRSSIAIVPEPCERSTDPIVVPSFLRIMVPVALLGTTVMVNVTISSNVAVVLEEERYVVVPARAMTCEIALLVLPAYPPPVNTAVIACVPAPSDDAMKVPDPCDIVAVPIVVVPSWMLTLPDAFDGDTVTVKRTLLPKVAGLLPEMSVVVVDVMLLDTTCVRVLLVALR